MTIKPSLLETTVHVEKFINDIERSYNRRVFIFSYIPIIAK